VLKNQFVRGETLVVVFVIRHLHGYAGAGLYVLHRQVKNARSRDPALDTISALIR
jgi:hypothetical protein